MTGYQSILAPTDFSDSATDAVRAATGLARHYKAELHLLHIVAAQVYYTEMPEMMLPPMEGLSEQLLTSGKEKLEKLASDLDKGLHPHIHVEESAARPADAIVETAANTRADLIVIGSHGRTGLSISSSVPPPNGWCARLAVTYWSSSRKKPLRHP